MDDTLTREQMIDEAPAPRRDLLSVHFATPYDRVVGEEIALLSVRAGKDEWHVKWLLPDGDEENRRALKSALQALATAIPA
jgi:hypothetical protein